MFLLFRYLPDVCFYYQVSPRCISLLFSYLPRCMFLLCRYLLDVYFYYSGISQTYVSTIQVSPRCMFLLFRYLPQVCLYYSGIFLNVCFYYAGISPNVCFYYSGISPNCVHFCETPASLPTGHKCKQFLMNCEITLSFADTDFSFLVFRSPEDRIPVNNYKFQLVGINK